MPAPFRPFRGSRVRTILIIIAVILATFHCFNYFRVVFPTPFRQPLESEWLEHIMNKDLKQLTSTSSFDWSTVQLRYPPTEARRLPYDLPLKLPRIQHRFEKESDREREERESRRKVVRNLFLKNWRSYRTFAWMKDALLPISAGAKDQFGGWAATLVDSLDTLWIMGLREEFDEAVEAVAGIDFAQTSSSRINMFETNIRYLGGLLAAYDLSQREVLLKKAVELGDVLFAGFNTENRMPVDFIDFKKAKMGRGLSVESSVVSASPGTLAMEMTRLSQLTGDLKYYTAVSQVMDVFEKGQNKTALPGVWPIHVSMASQDVTKGLSFTLGGCADSLYEYLPKMHALMGGLEPRYSAMSKAFMETANEYFFFRPMLPDNDDILISGNPSVGKAGTINLDPESEHLTCFIGGLFGLGGRLFKNETYVDVGAKLTRGCIYAYRTMPTGIMPERYRMVACPSRDNCDWDEDLWVTERSKRPEWKNHLPMGFTAVKDPRYILRPEAIESVFILYRVTGLKEFQDAAWDMFKAVRDGTETEYANAAILDVTTAEGIHKKEDYMESFWLAETLKYFYLAFSPPDLIDLDKYVLNTEAHPFTRPILPMSTPPLL